jgi:secondary thiamine-phosphate synthase enzyme
MCLQAWPVINNSMRTITIASTRREQMIDITSNVHGMLPDGDGVVVLFIQHTTCGLTVNENADPDVQSDMIGFLNRLIPQFEPNFRHFEHNSDAHIKSSLVGSGVTVPFENGKLMLGRWQGIYLCEFDGPRERSVLMRII